jgi:hypothetical protein
MRYVPQESWRGVSEPRGEAATWPNPSATASAAQLSLSKGLSVLI